uniref:Uncharacterized protein n=1 Tax=Anguilla anguilla TaxID=7936 RepID=A0A0E9VRZ3_ANGAN
MHLYWPKAFNELASFERLDLFYFLFIQFS